MRYLSLLLAFVFSFSLAPAIALGATDIPPPPTLAVKAYLLRDFNSNNIIAQQAGNDRIEPASLTKLRTA